MADTTATAGRALGWDDPIEKDSEFQILPAGDYDFEVTGFERARHNGSDKLPACNKAVLNIQLTGENGQTTTVKHNLFLHTSTEGMVCAFFTAIGQRKKGERIQPRWNEVTGGKGRCKVGVRKWISDKDGREYENNEIQKFYEKEATDFTPGKF